MYEVQLVGAARSIRLAPEARHPQRTALAEYNVKSIRNLSRGQTTALAKWNSSGAAARKTGGGLVEIPTRTRQAGEIVELDTPVVLRISRKAAFMAALVAVVNLIPVLALPFARNP